MAWIEAHQKLKDHPKVLDLMSLMNWDLDTTIGKLFRFWWWCVDYAEDGDLRKHNDGRLAMAVGLNSQDGTRFVEAMVQSCWIDREPYFRVHDWWDCIGKYLEIKYKRTPNRYHEIRQRYYNVTTTNTDRQTDRQTNISVRQPLPAFIPPTLLEIQSYCLERKNKVNPDRFFDFYQSKGWMVGKNKMKDWKAAVRTWEKEAGFKSDYKPKETIASVPGADATELYLKSLKCQ